MAHVSAHGNAGDADEWLALLREAGSIASIMKVTQHIFARETQGWFLVVLCLIWPIEVKAHDGPPYPIIENQKVGPCVISVWTDPDVGTGTFFVILHPTAEGTIPNDLTVKIGIQPESGRLPEVVYAADRDDLRGQVQYRTLAQFDRQEFWRVRIIVRSSQGSGEALSRVEATPPGFGRWDLLLYLMPFLAVAFLWFRGITCQRSRKKNKLQSM